MSFAGKKKKSHEMAKLFCYPSEWLAGTTQAKSQNEEKKNLGRSLAQTMPTAEINSSFSGL